jgi:hypothetical protein
VPDASHATRMESQMADYAVKRIDEMEAIFLGGL